MEKIKGYTKDKNYNLITLVLLWSAIVVMSSLYVTIPLISYFSNHFSVNSSISVWTSSIFSITFAIGSLFYGPLSNKYGKKKVILIGLIFLTIFSFLTGISDNIYMIIICRAFQGLAAATFSPVALSYIMEFFPTNKKVLALGFISTGFLIAGIVGQVFSKYVAFNFRWNYVFLILSLIYIITIILVTLFVPSFPATKADLSILTSIKSLANPLKIVNLRFIYVVSFVSLLSFVSMYAVLNSYLTTNKFNLCNNDILYINALGILGMLFSPISSNLIKRFSILSVLRISLLISVISLVFIGFINNVILLIIVSIIFVLGISLAVPALIALIGVASGKDKGSAVSLHTFILFIGTSVGPILTVDLINNNKFILAFILIAIILLIGIISTFFVKNLNK